MTVRVPSAAVLRARGVPITLHKLVTDEQGEPVRPYKRAFTSEAEDAEPELEHTFIQFTNAVLADLEDAEVGFGSMDAWQTSLGVQPFIALSRTIAISLEWWVPGASTPGGGPVPDLRRAGKAMFTGKADDYSTIVGTAFALANGVEPERAVDLLKAGVKSAEELRPLINQHLDKMLEQEEAAIARAKVVLAAAADTPTSPEGTVPATPGSSGSQGGSGQAGTSTSSGG